MKKQSRKQTGKSLQLSTHSADHHIDGIDPNVGDDRRLSDTKPASKSKKKTSSSSKSKKKGRRRSIAEEEEEEDKDEYCICRTGYDGNEFMIECDGCKEWFHGRCVGVKPKPVVDTYFCDACLAKSNININTTSTKSKSKTKKSSTKQNTARRKNKKSAAVEETIPTITISLSRENDEDEDLDDICPVCDTECTCGTASVQVAQNDEKKPVHTSKRPTDVWQVTDIEPTESKVVERYGPGSDKANDSSKLRTKTKQKKNKKNKKSSSKGKTLVKHEVSSDDGLDVNVDGNITIKEGVDEHDDDDDDKASIGAESRTESYASSVHIDSGDDEGLEEEEERAIIEEMMENEHELSEIDESDDDASGLEADNDSDDDDISVEEYYYVDEDDENDDEEEAIHGYHFKMADPWSSSEDEEEDDSSSELYIEDDVEATAQNEHLQPLLGDAHLFDSIAAAFLQILAPLAESSNSGNQSSSADMLGGELDLSGLDISALTAELSAAAATTVQSSSDLHRRPSLPSSAVSAAQNHHSAEDMTSERLGALSALASDGALGLSLPTISEKPEETAAAAESSQASNVVTDMQTYQAQQLLDLVQMATAQTAASRTALGTNNISFSAPTSPTQQIHPFLTLEQSSGLSQQHERQATHALDGDKRRGSAPDTLHGGKKRRLSIAQNDKSPSSPSSPAESEPTPVSMDELVDTSQLYTRSSSDVDEDEVDTRFSRDLSRWQRVPIGAFRLMRSKNKLWLER